MTVSNSKKVWFIAGTSPGFVISFVIDMVSLQDAKCSRAQVRRENP